MDHRRARPARAAAVQQLLVNHKNSALNSTAFCGASAMSHKRLWAGSWSRRAICERCRARFAPNSSGPTPAPPARRGGEIAQEEGVWSWFLLCWRVLATRTAHGRDGGDREGLGVLGLGRDEHVERRRDGLEARRARVRRHRLRAR